MTDENKSFADPDSEAERASHDLPEQIARARARFDRFRDTLERLEVRRRAVEGEGAEG